MLSDLGVSLDGVLLLSVETDDLVGRLLLRAQQQDRADDTERVIQRRQEVYREQTAPLIHEYGARGLLHEVNGTGHVDHVTDRLHTAIARIRRATT